MIELSNNDPLLFVATVFFILSVLMVIFLIIHHKIKKNMLPKNKTELMKKHDQLVEKEKFKDAINLGYAYIKMVENEDNEDNEEFGFTYSLISQDFERLGEIKNAAYFAHLAAAFYQKSSKENNNSDQLQKESRAKVFQLKATLSALDQDRLSNKIKLFDEEDKIYYS